MYWVGGVGKYVRGAYVRTVHKNIQLSTSCSTVFSSLICY